MKKQFLFILLVVVLMIGMAMPALAFTQGFNLDDFKLNPGASIYLVDEPELYGGKALEGDDRDDDAATHFSILNFSVPADGKYGVWFLVWAESEAANSLYISLDGGDMFTFDYMESDEQPNPDFEYYYIWYWMWMNARHEISEAHDLPMDGFNAYMTGQKKFFDLKAGDHSLKITTREPYAKYAGVIITDDLNYDPNNDPALQVGKIDPASVYPDPAILAAAEAAAEAEAAAREAEAAAQESSNAAASSSPKTGDTAIILFAIAVICSVVVLARKRAKN